MGPRELERDGWGADQIMFWLDHQTTSFVEVAMHYFNPAVSITQITITNTSTQITSITSNRL